MKLYWSPFLTVNVFIFGYILMNVRSELNISQPSIRLVLTVPNQKSEVKHKYTFKDVSLEAHCKNGCIKNESCLSYDFNEQLKVCENHFSIGRLHQADGWVHGTKTKVAVS